MNRLRLFLGTSLIVAALYQLVQDAVLVRDVREHAVAFEEDAFEEDAFEEDVVVTNTSDCIDVHPRVKNNSMLHVVFALDRSQIPGVQASIASIVHHSNDASTVTIHVMVQDRWSSKFRHRFGIRPNCSATASASGAVIVLHALEASTLAGAVARVPQSYTKTHGALDTMENFARFYMHLVLGGLTVVYLDADTIVQSDLRKLRDKLTASNRTLGFIKRPNPLWQLKNFLREPACMTVSRKDLTAPRKPRTGLVAALQAFKEKVVQGIKSPEQKDREMLAKLPVSQREELLHWRKLMEKTACYNVGVLVVNLQRWADTNVSKRIESYVKRYNDCGGELWLGGSQPPLLLAFQDHDNTTANDFITFPAKWNRDGLGWIQTLDAERLKESSVLHWNGNRKPWMEHGLYKQLWRPHYERFFSVFTPPEGGRRRSHFWRPHYFRFLSVSTPPEGGRRRS